MRNTVLRPFVKRSLMATGASPSSMLRLYFPMQLALLPSPRCTSGHNSDRSTTREDMFPTPAIAPHRTSRSASCAHRHHRAMSASQTLPKPPSALSAPPSLCNFCSPCPASLWVVRRHTKPRSSVSMSQAWRWRSVARFRSPLMRCTMFFSMALKSKIRPFARESDLLKTSVIVFKCSFVVAFPTPSSDCNIPSMRGASSSLRNPNSRTNRSSSNTSRAPVSNSAASGRVATKTTSTAVCPGKSHKIERPSSPGAASLPESSNSTTTARSPSLNLPSAAPTSTAWAMRSWISTFTS